MALIALIDDDPVEALVIEGLLEHTDTGHAVSNFTTVEAFVDASGAAPDLVLLDRRIPPHQSFKSSLDALSGSAFNGPVVLVTAGPADETELSWRGALHGPVNKAELLTPEALEDLLNAVLG